MLIEIKHEGVKFSATDLENYLTIEPVIKTYGGEGLICVNANYLNWFINKSFEKEITIEFIGEKCKMTCGIFHVVVDTDKAENYPKCPVLEPKRKFEFTKTEIKYLTLATKFIGHDDLRPAMTGVYLDGKDGNITIASTDAHRLYWQKTEIEADEIFSCIIPSKGLGILLNTFKKEFTLEPDANHVKCSTEKCELTIRKIDVRYPNYRAVLIEPNLFIFIDRKTLLNYLGFACYFSHHDTRQIKIRLKEGYAELVTHGGDFNDAEVINKIAITKTDKTEYTFGVNANFLYDVAICSAAETIEIKTMSSPTKAMIIDNHILLMPLMLNQ